MVFLENIRSMRPDEEMHSAVGEVDLDPCDLYIDLGTLIVEGRVPGLTERGFGEGPHCPPLQGQNRHQCDPSSSECQRYEQIQKHMLLLWKNGIPMSIEVLMYPPCCAGSTSVCNVDTASVSEMSYILLEQWTVHMLPRRVSHASISPRGLMQAVRSFLYFSQLCAWLSLTGGKSPQNVHYRLCVPGEAFSSKFTVHPDSHDFPVANIGRNTSMKVTAKTHPRFEKIPTVLCSKHSHSESLKPGKQAHNSKTDHLEPLPEDPSSYEEGAEGDYVCDGLLPTAYSSSSRTSSPADSMLGESLLDPPNSLCMYPKRYQSPSRCGSPSVEVPEHLMFGKGAIAKQEAQMHRLKQETKSRSRPQRRPVVERFLKKTLGNEIEAPSSSERKCPCIDKLSSFNDLSFTDDESEVSHDGLVNYLCLSNDPKTLPRAEVEHVLDRLRNRCQRSKNSPEAERSSYLLHKNEDYNLLKSNLSVSKCLQDSKINIKKIPIEQENPFCVPHKFIKPSIFHGSSPHSSNQPNSEEILVRRICEQSKPSRKIPCQTESDHHSANPCVADLDAHIQRGGEETIRSSAFRQKQNFLETSHKILRDQKNGAARTLAAKTGGDLPVAKDETPGDSNIVFPNTITKNTYQKHRTICDEIKPSNDISVKSGPLYCEKFARTRSTELNDCKMPCKSPPISPLLRSLFKPGHIIPSPQEGDNISHLIPSAEEKAQFRRSLDSATNLVFHQKNGLPLTSSPAPIRKSGTCFDFDSSLTTVSAIKRALFEKEPDDDEEPDKENALHLSISAPASTTISSLLGTFEESVLNGRLEPVSTVEGFTAEIGASGSFCPRHIILPVTVFFYTLQDTDKVTSPYLGHINLGKKEYFIPKKGTVQVTLFNPHRTVVKMYVVRYDLSDMPPNSQTFLRQRTLYMPTDASENDPEARKWLRYLIHLRFASTKSGRIFLHTDIRVIIFRKSDLDAATVHGQRPYELRSFTHGPANPKFSPHQL